MIPEYVIAAVLILQMGSDEYRIREAASKKMKGMAYDALIGNFGNRISKKDPEIRLRLKEWLSRKPKVIDFKNPNSLVGKWLWKSSWVKDPYVVEFFLNGRHYCPHNELKGTWKVCYESSGECLLTMTYDSNGGAADAWVIESAKEGFRGRLQRDGGYRIVVTPTK